MVESVNVEENIFTLRKLMIDCRNTAKAEELQKQETAIFNSCPVSWQLQLHV